MSKMKFMVLFMSLAIILGGCASMNNAGKGAAIGGGSGAALGAILGGVIGKGKGAAIGAAIGTAVGAGAGAAIGHKMDKKAAEAARIEGAQVEKVKDANGLDAVKVSFSSGILFPFNSSALSNSSKNALAEFATVLKEDPTIDIAVLGHTDKVGSYEANQKVSNNRAFAVQKYLQQCGVSPSQFKAVKGMGYSQYDESKAADQNRRVEVYMYASEQMIKNAEAAN
ncbi:OmpA family protein [Bacteroides pyogenes F0041]|uniref:OmpA family protein n=1 Tax=Bacteroides pyogenes F0041 TaxID=1321819 RepID=U2CSF5_9BACE|nr:OmpA family protein [Bacteroides pyogenes]ERI87008.1 OmpA family protein [Bacteroides pyogenes F0041]MBB3895827.1 outer membrane protein OmpA-like peptidoglycan-associated protein [Bacteroides pyogenes]GAE23873.1 OmpA family outer membrane protein [Bacteroides pyogenes JCM 10003]SUV34770.1 putative outer membrane protein OmpA-family [Bacteroides pyogenes]